jgi:hypothetical protein
VDRSREIARGYTASQRALNYLGFVVWVVLVASNVECVMGLAPCPSITGGGWIVAAALLTALPVADFITGFVHWAADNIGDENWPIVGGFVKPFRNHHLDPEGITRHGFWEMHGDHFVATLLLLCLATWVDGDGAITLFWKAMWLGVATFVIATAKFHAWAHTEEPPHVVRWLQRRRIILSPEHHAKHHVPPHGTHYCITNGWMNAPLRAIRFFELCEWIMIAVTGAEPITRQPRKETVQERETSGFRLGSGQAPD